MGMKWKNAPICYALGQVQFNSIQIFDQHLPAIQDSFRRKGYPDFQKVFTASINLNFNPQPANETAASAVSIPLTRYRFTNAARTSSFLLDSNFLVFETTQYDTFDPFAHDLVRGLDFIHKAVALSYSERIGIRFLDAVVPRDGEELSLYLKPEVLGLSAKLPKRKMIHAVSETRTDKDSTVLISRVMIYSLAQKGSVGFPPDLQIQGLKLADKFVDLKEGTYATIDTDCWREERSQSFDLTEIDKTLHNLHTEVSSSFGLMVTPDAIKIWE